MSRLATCAVRSLFVLFAYCVASLAASLFLHLLLFGVLGLDLDQPPWAEMGGLPVSVLLITFIVAYFAFVPSIALIFIAEIRGWRSWLYYGIAGAGAATVVAAMFWRASGYVGAGLDLGGGAPSEAPIVLMPEVVAGALGAGFAAGLVYWLIAGRSAGGWRRSPPAATARGSAALKQWPQGPGATRS